MVQYSKKLHCKQIKGPKRWIQSNSKQKLSAHLLNEADVHDHQQAKESDGDGEVDVLKDHPYPRREELGEHPWKPRVDAEEGLFRIHLPPFANPTIPIYIPSAPLP